MTPERYQKAGRLYHAALEIEPEARAAFLDEECGSDEELRREAESLLRAHDKVGDYFAAPALEVAAGLLAERQSLSLAGQGLSHYRVLSLIGAGGMGEVYLAEDISLGRKVALKLLPKEFTEDPERVRRFELEARAASSLNHPNIMTIFEVGQVDGCHFIATEYIDGQTLRERLSGGQLDVREALDVAAQISSALEAAHEAGIVHRDIKPENVIVRPDGLVKVLDFGLAKLTERKGRSADPNATTEVGIQTTPGLVLGTVSYMSPEQARGLKVDARSDNFSLAVVMYEMVAGCCPFEGATASDVMAAILQNEPVPLAQFAQNIPAELERIVAKALCKDREERYQTAGELSVDLRSLKQELEVEARLKGSLQTDGDGRKITTPSGSPAASLSIAVLPFVNMSADSENEYFCDGLAEELLSSLSKIGALRVAARTSAFSFKGKKADIRRIGQMLNVGTVLEGSVRKAGNRVRITAQLVNVADGYRVWSERYDREMRDIFDVQDEISLAIVDALKVKLLGSEKAAVLKRSTDNAEAYQLYLLGRYHYSKWTVAGFKKSIEYYEQAIEKEPNYALAFTGLYGSYAYLLYFGFLSPRECVPNMKAAATRALAIDSALAESHQCMARLKYTYEWDWTGAEREFSRAFELNANYAEAHERFGALLALTGRTDEAISHLERAIQLDPLSLLGNMNIAWTFWGMGLYDRMHELARKLIDLEPNFFGGHQLLGLEYWSRRKLDEAISEYRSAVDLGSGVTALGALGALYAVVGEREKAQQILDQLGNLSGQRYVQVCSIALVYAGMGESDRSFEYLEQACEQHEGHLPSYLKYARFLIPELSSDPRYADLLRRIGLPM